MMWEPIRLVKVPVMHNKRKIEVLEPNITEILKEDFNYAQYADEIIEDLIARHYPKKGEEPKIQGHFSGIDDNVSLFLEEEEKPPLSPYQQFDNEYRQAIHLLQHKYEYNLDHHNPYLNQMNIAITNAMKSLAIIFLDAEGKKEEYNITDYEKNLNEALKNMEENIFADYTMTAEDVDWKIRSSIPEVVDNFQFLAQELKQGNLKR